MDATIRDLGERYEAGLLWRDENATLPLSKSAAMSRLFQMENKMDKDPHFAEQYLEKIAEYENKGFARKLNPAQANVEGPRTFYLSHFMNYNPKKPQKLRFVFDAAAKIQGKSLNDFLLKGPDQVTSLPSVLFKFRQRPIAITGDIKDMFHRVLVRKEDVDSQRFLFRGLDRHRDPDVMEMSVLIFGATCSPAIAQEVKNLNAKRYEKEFPEACKAIVNRHFVDDYLDSCDDNEQSFRRITEVTEVHRRGGFEICKWTSNSLGLIKKIPEGMRADAVKEIALDASSDNSMERVLGLFWKPRQDILTFSTNFIRVKEGVLNGEVNPTKRQALALLMSIFDPLGFLSLFTVKAKILLQTTWKSQIGWDDQLPPEVQEKWTSWVAELRRIEDFQLPRCYSLGFANAESLQLHIFCDASEQAYGAVAYFRIASGDRVEVSLVSSKSRVTPLKTTSIPRLELQAAVIGSRLGQFIQQEHEISIGRTFYWSDSRTVICWLRATQKKFHQFVSHRVGEIQEITDVNQWKWIPTKENVADELTRDNKECDWSLTSRWINGPSFLKQSEDQWPHEKSLKDDDILPQEPEPAHLVYVIKPKDNVMEVTKFSSWRRMLRVTAYVFRVWNFCMGTGRKKLRQLLAVSPQEITRAETFLIKQSQAEMFPAEVTCLIQSKSVPKTSKLFKLNPFVGKDGIIRMQSRIQKAQCVGDKVKNPIILCPTHHMTKLIISSFHVEGGHHGQERVVNELRQKYHIINIRTAVRSSWNRCQKCKLARAQPRVPEMGQLPISRLETKVSPFTYTGLDYFGPLEVTVKRSHEKRYGALFTCLTTRAVHVEIAHALTTDACIMAIRRFVGRRGCPTDIWSDNGTNFEGANNELKRSLQDLNQNTITSECASRGISWHFIPPAAPHMGGSWERMVRCIKVALEATILERFPTDEVLETLMIEAEHTVNSHPLTHVPLDPDDPESLTPNHFLIGRSSNLQPVGKFSEVDMCLRKQWRKAQTLADYFWRRWLKEYLPTLRQRSKWFTNMEPIKEGDIVLEINSNAPRNSWPKAVVTKLFPGEDGLVRVVEIQNAGGHVFRRPVAKLIVLDVQKRTEETKTKKQADNK